MPAMQLLGNEALPAQLCFDHALAYVELSFKTVDKPHKKQTIIVGPLKIEIEFSDVIGWVMRVQ